MLIERPAFADIENGYLDAAEAPGTGLRLKDEALKRYAYRHAVQKST